MAYPATPKTWVAGDVLTAAQLNAELRDALLAAFPLGANAWTAWTPTLTNLTLGNGTVTARYTRIGRTITYYLKIEFGTTSSMGADPRFSPPVATAAMYSAADQMGLGEILDVATANIGALVHWVSATVFSINTWNVAGTHPTVAALSSTVPMTWTTGDTIAIRGTYEAAT